MSSPVEYLPPIDNSALGEVLAPPTKIYIPPSFKPPRVFPSTGTTEGKYWTDEPRFEKDSVWSFNGGNLFKSDDGAVKGAGVFKFAMPEKDVASGGNITYGSPLSVLEEVDTFDVIIGFKNCRSLGPVQFIVNSQQHVISPPGDGMWRWSVKKPLGLSPGQPTLQMVNQSNCWQPRWEEIPNGTDRLNFPTTVPFGIAGWKLVDGLATYAFSKGKDGRIYIDYNAEENAAGITWFNDNYGGLFNWECVVDYVIPGGTINIASAAGETLQVINKPGRYSGVGSDPQILTGKKAFGPNFSPTNRPQHIISYFNQWPAAGVNYQFGNPYRFDVDFFWFCAGKYTDLILNQQLLPSRVGQYVRSPNGLDLLPGQQVLYGDTPPLVGYFTEGDVCYNTGIGDNWCWRCVENGYPGRWEAVPAPPPVP
jgi:hypothetical protein